MRELDWERHKSTLGGLMQLHLGVKGRGCIPFTHELEGRHPVGIVARVAGGASLNSMHELLTTQPDLS